MLAVCAVGWWWHIGSNSSGGQGPSGQPPVAKTAVPAPEQRWTADGQLRVTETAVQEIGRAIEANMRAGYYADSITLRDGTRVPVAWERKEFGYCPAKRRPNVSITGRVAVPMTLMP